LVGVVGIECTPIWNNYNLAVASGTIWLKLEVSGRVIGLQNGLQIKALSINESRLGTLLVDFLWTYFSVLHERLALFLEKVQVLDRGILQLEKYKFKFSPSSQENSVTPMSLPAELKTTPREP
jgi:hypothetical protein